MGTKVNFTHPPEPCTENIDEDGTCCNVHAREGGRCEDGTNKHFFAYVEDLQY